MKMVFSFFFGMEFTDFTFRKGVGDSEHELESDVLSVV